MVVHGVAVLGKIAEIGAVGIFCKIGLELFMLGGQVLEDGGRLVQRESAVRIHLGGLTDVIGIGGEGVSGINPKRPQGRGHEPPKLLGPADVVVVDRSVLFMVEGIIGPELGLVLSKQHVGDEGSPGVGPTTPFGFGQVLSTLVAQRVVSFLIAIEPNNVVVLEGFPLFAYFRRTHRIEGQIVDGGGGLELTSLAVEAATLTFFCGIRVCVGQRLVDERK